MAWILICGIFSGDLQAADKSGIELVGEPTEIQPGQTLEFRFAAPMIAAQRVGSTKEEGPVEIEPEIPSRFTWLSTRSGVLSFDDVPPLDTVYRVTARAGLRSASGAAVGKSFLRKLSTPAFGVVSVKAPSEDEVLPAFPEVALSFNAQVDLENARGAFRFVDAAGVSIPAAVRFAAPRDGREDLAAPGDWSLRWQLVKDPAAIRKVESDEDWGQPIPNCLIVSPERPLPVGKGWRLEMAAGLASADGRFRIDEPQSFQLGSVAPLELESISPRSFVHTGRSVTLEFNEPLAPDISPETAGRFFSFEPSVKELSFEEGWRSITARGDFQLGTKYKVTVGEAVISAQGRPFGGQRVRYFEFQPVAPRLYVPEITAQQLLGGRERFDVLSVNLAALKISALLVDPADVPKAVQAFDSGYRRTDYDPDNPDEMFQPLPKGAIKGRVLSEETIPFADGKIDEKRETALHWSKILGEQKAGVIFLTVEGKPLAEVPSKRPAAQALIQLTDLGVLWKKLDGQLRVSVFSMKTGEPVSGASVAILDDAFDRIASGETGADGLASLAIEKRPSWLTIQQGEDVHVLRLGDNAEDLPMSAFRVPVYYRGWDAGPTVPGQYRLLLFTDRPLYRPGEEVHIKGIVREVEGGKLALPVDFTGKLIVTGPRGEVVSETSVKADATGAFDADVLPSVPTQGEFYVRLEPSQGSIEYTENSTCSFDITDYQPNAFELSVDLKPAPAAGSEPFEARVTGSYFFGGAISKAEVRWNLRYEREDFNPKGFEDFRFLAFDTSPKPFMLQGKAELATGAPALIEPQLPAPEGGPYGGRLTVEVTDINQQTVSESRRFTRQSSDFYIGISDRGYQVVEAGKPFAISFVAVRPDGQPLDEAVDATVSLIQLRHNVARVQGAGGAVTFRNDTEEKALLEKAAASVRPVDRQGVWQVPDAGTVELVAPAPGEYRVRVSAKDSGGRKVVSDLPIFVQGKGEVVWDYRNPAQIDLVPDKQEYEAGDVAKILVKTPMSGRAKVTIERGEKVLREMDVRLEGNAPTIEVPIGPEDAPNVYVSLMLIRGADESARKFKVPEYRYGLCMLRVADPRSELRVSVEPLQPKYEPGEQITAEVQVLNGKGEPVKGADVTFFAVDDGILALKGYQRPMPGATFGSALPLQVRTGLSLYSLMPEDPADLEFSNKGYLIGGGGDEGPGVKLRDNFPGTACWFPNLRTDERGRLRVEFPAPDALTRYRLVAVAHAGADAFGSGESAVAIAKPLMLLPSLGQFANAGDEIRARAVVRNDTGSAGKVRVRLEPAPGVRLKASGEQTIDVPAGESRSVDFPVKFEEPGLSPWKWTAELETQGRRFEDHVESTIHVGWPAPLLRETYLYDLKKKETDLLAEVNPQVLEGQGGAVVTVSNTRLASLRESAGYLLEYPYGCAEQTVSSLVPWIVLSDLEPILPGLKVADRKKVVHKAIEKIAALQTDAGGLAFWPGASSPSLFASAWAAVAMAQLPEMGEALPETQRSALLDYLSKSLRSDSKAQEDVSTRVLAAYALSLNGRPEPAYHEAFYKQRAILSRWARSVLALAILSANGPVEMVKTLLDPRTAAPEDFSPFGGTGRDLSAQLWAWTAYQPKSQETARLVKELLAARRGGRWQNTQDNAWALLAVRSYFTEVEQRSKTPRKPVQGELLIGDRTVAFKVDDERPVASEVFAVKPGGSEPVLKVENPSASNLYGQAQFAVYPPVSDQPAQNRGFAISRSFQKLSDDGSLQPIRDLKVGDRVLVTLRVEAGEVGNFVAIDDPLPAILEAVNPRFTSRAVAGAPGGGDSMPIDYREVRADRVLAFCNRLPAGVSTFSYLARVRSAGETTAPPAKVEEMYRPERFGLSAAEKVSSSAAR